MAQISTPGSWSKTSRDKKGTDEAPIWGPSSWGNKTSRDKKGTDEASIWGHKDPLWTIADDPGRLESEMVKYLRSFEDSHWRLPHGTLKHTSYSAFHQNDKRVGMMILDAQAESECRRYALHAQFNIIMDMKDPRANIEAMHEALKSHIMLMRDSDEQQIIHQWTKDRNAVVPKGDHASPWDILFRTVKLRIFKMGLTKNGDLLIGMGFRRLLINYVGNELHM